MQQDFNNMRVVVAGFGRSGRSAAGALLERGAFVRVADRRDASELAAAAAEFPAERLRLLTGERQMEALDGAGLIVVSPGVPADTMLLQEGVRRGIPVWSEVELACRLRQVRMIAVTGTNGKTTTTSLVGALLQHAGLEVAIAGNIGLPLVDGVSASAEDGWVVAEISSFQMEWIEEFHARVALLLNLTEDHLDRHGTLEEYAAMKKRVFNRQDESDYAVLNADDPLVREAAAGLRSRVLFFSRRSPLDEGAFLEEGRMVLRISGRRYDLGLPSEMKLRGGHNIENALAAALAGAACGLDELCLREALQAFPGVEHRIETADIVDGVEYINDSKGTNPDAAIKAFEAMDRPFILIAGGRDKGTDFTLFGRTAASMARHVILIGEAAGCIAESLKAAGSDRFSFAGDMEGAVRAGADMARPGDAVLLSPGCASFDMFRNYEERGRVFKEAVAALKKG